MKHVLIDSHVCGLLSRKGTHGKLVERDFADQLRFKETYSKILTLSVGQDAKLDSETQSNGPTETAALPRANIAQKSAQQHDVSPQELRVDPSVSSCVELISHLALLEPMLRDYTAELYADPMW